MLDVVVVGGGPAGASTALALLACAPTVRVAILDRARFPREKTCAGAIGARADRALEALGVRIEVPNAVVRAVSVVARDGSVGARRPTPIGRVVRRIEFDASLVAEAARRGADVRESHKVIGLEVLPDRVRVVHDRGTLDARVVVGADGAGSVVRRAIGLPRAAVVAQAIEVDTEPFPHEPDDELRFDVRDRSYEGYAWDFPTPLDGARRVSRGVYALDRADIEKTLARRLDALGARPIGPARRWAERGFEPGRLVSVRRVLLVGEAAGIDPVLGEGIPQAIQGGSRAGTYLAAALERGTLDFGDWASHFRRSRVGLDLHVRSRLIRLVYGATRDRFERGLLRSPALARAGASYFAGERVSRWDLARAAYDFARAFV